ncbi:hypothetical protein TorRG33x02_330570 [Trema orientale]|uniref:Uncharacterized protein n=1 Tax=Trema orientale TaxID=63057 RepID=A0A2P5B717_TREOI|nr:hypothetical protein TorRG33x02_330570 [Trema orientale]
MDEIHSCVIKLRENPQKRRDKVCTGCRVRFGGDRPLGALKLLQIVKESAPLLIGIKLWCQVAMAMIQGVQDPLMRSHIAWKV